MLSMYKYLKVSSGAIVNLILKFNSHFIGGSFAGGTQQQLLGEIVTNSCGAGAGSEFEAGRRPGGHLGSVVAQEHL